MTIKDALDEFKLYLTVEKNYSLNTIESYMRDLKDFQSYLTSIQSLQSKTFLVSIFVCI